jgi:hypothetical protein
MIRKECEDYIQLQAVITVNAFRKIEPAPRTRYRDYRKLVQEKN